MMSRRKFASWVVIVSTLAASISLVGALSIRNMSWLNEWPGTIVVGIASIGVSVGVLGGVGLAFSRDNPLWLIAAITSVCVGCSWWMLLVAFGLGGMH